MRKLILILSYVAVLAACATTRQASVPAAWAQRMDHLQRSDAWQLEGRAAVAVGAQGWQASLNWRQLGPAASEVHLAGPFGVGALVLTETPDGVSLNGAPPSDAVAVQLRERLGFELPLNDLRYWLLGVPDPGASFDVSRNDQDRARQLSQSGWTVDYDRYLPVGGDWLPGHLVLSREGVRVRIAIDHWVGPQ